MLTISYADNKFQKWWSRLMLLKLDRLALLVGGALLYTYEPKSESSIMWSFISVQKPYNDVTLHKFLVDFSQGRISNTQFFVRLANLKVDCYTIAEDIKVFLPFYCPHCPKRIIRDSGLRTHDITIKGYPNIII